MMKKLIPLLLVLLCFEAQAQQHEYQLSIHITDTDQSAPAEGMTVVLYHFSETSTTWRHVDTKVTNEQGRIDDFLPGLDHEGVYRMVLRNQKYFQQKGGESLFPLIPIVLRVETGMHYQLPITVSKNGYTTHRGD